LLKDSSFTLVQVGFHAKLYLLDEAQRTGVVIEEGEEEQWDDNDIIPDGACFNDTAMGEAEEEVAA
jgi:hypothetical protein